MQRPLTLEDAEAAAALHALCFPDPWSAAAMQASLSAPGARAIGLWHEGRLIAFGLTQEVAGEAELLTIATAPELRGQGRAASLLAALISALETAGTRRLMLEVAEDNTAARRLYARFGFTEDGRRRGYYSAGRDVPVDAVLMSRPV